MANPQQYQPTSFRPEGPTDIVGDERVIAAYLGSAMLMLDEPSQGIMPRLVDEIFNAIEVIRQGGATVLVVEQRLTECLEIADRAYAMRTGRVLMSGTAAQIQDSMELRQAYLGL